MNRLLCFLSGLTLIAASCSTESKGPVKLILETDMGNDVDDAVALDLSYKYMEDGLADLLAVSLNKTGRTPAAYVDLMNCWYGFPDIPVGICLDGIQKPADDVNYTLNTSLSYGNSTTPAVARNFTAVVSSLKNEEGTALFPGKVDDLDALPGAVELLRKTLASQRNHSVNIVSVGFSTNLVRLMDTPADDYSKLSGMDLIKKKVRSLTLMAGRFDVENGEYNVYVDIPAATRLFGEWPTDIVTSPWELGNAVRIPASCIENDFGWTGAHPLVEGYKQYLPMPYDRQMWDPTALIYAVEGEKYFGISEPGIITVDKETGVTRFCPDPDGHHRYLSVDEQQASELLKHIIELVTRVPVSRNK